MTERLYYSDAYTIRFVSTVTRAEVVDEDHVEVVLGSTCFYPTSGGQLFDHGRLAGLSVVDVRDEGEHIVHLLEGGPAPAVGAEVEGEIDAARRAHHRQQHTGQHVLSRAFEELLDLPTISSRLGETGNTLDVESPPLDENEIERVEIAANRIVAEDRPVHIRFLEGEALERAALRKRPEREGPLRVIEVEGYDRSACGGTHCRRTAEIGLIAITRIERVKRLLRVHFLCGDRAAEHRRRRDRLVSRLTQALTTGENELEAVVDGLRRDLKESQKLAEGLARELVGRAAGDWIDDAEPFTWEGKAGRLVIRRLPVALHPAAQEAQARLVERQDVLCLLHLEQGGRHQLLLARGGGLSLDCGRLLGEILETVGGRGGGPADRARGGFTDGDPEAVETALRRRLGLS